jgi:hypothetical protein
MVAAVVVLAGGCDYDAPWRETANRLGLTKTGVYPRVAMSGNLDGVRVAITYQVTRSPPRRRRGKTTSSGSTHYTMKVQAYPNVPIADLTVSDAGFFSTIGTMLGGQDITIGDSQFDRAYVIRCSDEALARRVLGAAARKAMLEAESTVGDVDIEGGAVVWTAGSTTPGATFDKNVKIVAGVARAIGT